MINPSRIKLIAFDLDGTLTQHKTPLSHRNRLVLTQLSHKYRLLMVGAGQCRRIFNQMEGFPIDIIGNYGLQYAAYDSETRDIRILQDLSFPCDRESVEQKVTAFRQKYGYTQFSGDNVEYHPSGCITLPILGTTPRQEDKLAFDPDRTKRRALYQDVCDQFPSYHVFVGGSSSFDMAPKPYNKYYALNHFCEENKLHHNEVVFVGDDYGTGGNDESVYRSDFPFICVDDYTTFPEKVHFLL